MNQYSLQDVTKWEGILNIKDVIYYDKIRKNLMTWSIIIRINLIFLNSRISKVKQINLSKYLKGLQIKFHQKVKVSLKMLVIFYHQVFFSYNIL